MLKEDVVAQVREGRNPVPAQRPLTHSRSATPNQTDEIFHAVVADRLAGEEGAGPRDERFAQRNHEARLLRYNNNV